MVVMFVRNRVKDFKKWKSVFDSNKPAARDAGLRVMNLWRDMKDPNNVFFILEVANIDKARAFISDPAAAESGERSGVLDGEYHFLEDSPHH